MDRNLRFCIALVVLALTPSLAWSAGKASPMTVGDLSFELEDGYRPVIHYRSQVMTRGAYFRFHSYDWKTMHLSALSSWQGAPSKVRRAGLPNGGKRVALSGAKNGVDYELTYDLLPEGRIEIALKYSYEEGRPPCAVEYGVALLPPGAYVGRWCTYGREGRLLLPISPTPGANRTLFAANEPSVIELYSRLGEITFRSQGGSEAPLRFVDWRDYAHAKLKSFLILRSVRVAPGSSAELRTTLRVSRDAALPPELLASQKSGRGRASLAAPASYAFPLVPAPKEMTIEPGAFDAAGGLRVVPRIEASAKEKADLQTFAEDLAGLTGRPVTVESQTDWASPRPVALLLPVGSARPGAASLPAGEWRKHAEGYALRVTPNGIVLTGADDRGLWYATRMAYQILANAHDAGPAKPASRCVSVSSWPDHNIRGMHISLKPKTDLALLERLLKCLALYHYNTVLVEVFDAVKYDDHPLGSAPNAISKDRMRDVIAVGRRYGLEMVPGINSLGHAQGWLFQPYRLDQLESFKDLMEDASRPRARRQRTLCPSNPKARELLFGIYGELLDLFESKRFFVGLDEVFDWCKCERCRGKAPASLFAGHIKKLHNHLHARGIEMWMFQDMFLEKKDWPLGVPAHSHETAAALAEVPREGLIMACWQYSPDTDYPAFKHFIDRGLTCVGFTWFQPPNIWGYSRYARKVGAAGMVGTTWSGPGAAPWGWQVRTEKQHLASYVRAGDAFWSCDLPRSAPKEEGYEPKIEIERHYARHAVTRSALHVPLNIDRWRNWDMADAVAGDNAPAGLDYGPDHDLSCLTRCRVGMGGVPFHGLSAGKIITLRGVWEPVRRAAEAARGIAVNRPAKALMFLHTCGWQVKNGTPVAQYVMHFEDGGSQTQEIIYGRDVLAFDSDLYMYDRLDTNRTWPSLVGLSRAGTALRFHVLRWTNPRPEVKVASIDLVSLDTCAAPMVLAVTVEAPHTEGGPGLD